MNNKKSLERLKHLAFFLIALLGMGLLALSTRHGTGIGGDATIYIFSARNLLEGHGLGLIGPEGAFRLIPYFPPFYSLVLSVFGLLGLEMAAGAYWLNLLLFGGLIWLSGAVAFRFSRSIWFSMWPALLLALSPVLVPVYSWAMSEPLALMLGFGGLAVLVESLEKKEKKGLFYFSAVLTGLAFLTRYPAVVFLGVGALCAVMFLQGRWFARLLRGAAYFLVGFVPMAVWLLVDLAHTDTVASRSVESAAGMAQRFVSLWPRLGDVFLFWMIPDSWIASPPYPVLLNRALLLAGILLLLGWVALVGRKVLSRTDEREDALRSYRWGIVLVLFILAYLLMIALVYIFTFPPITIGSRMLSPVHVAVIWLLPLLLHSTLQAWPAKRWMKVVIVVMGVASIGWYGARTARIVEQNYRFGQGYLSPAWQGSQVIQALQELPEDTPIVTNDQTAVLYLSGRSAYALAEIYRDDPQVDFSRYGDGTLSDDPGQEAFRHDGAVLVLFDSIGEQMQSIYGDRTGERVEKLVEGLDVDFQGEDGVIYVYPGMKD